MDDYIRRKDAVEWFMAFIHMDEDVIPADTVASDLKHAIPTADVQPVRHAEWEWFDELNGSPLEGQDRDWGWRCSHCKTELPDDYDDPDCKPEMKYCHECGAKMDGGTGNEA